MLASFSQQHLSAELEKAQYFAVWSDASNSGHTKVFPYGVKYGLLDFYED